MRRNHRSKRIARLAALSLTVCATTVSASSLSNYGARFGVSVDPDQFTLGMYAAMPEFAPGLSFRPSADLGFGDDALTLMGNADVQYTFHATEGRLVPHVGGGITLFWFDPDPGESDAEVGISLYGGVEFAMKGYKTGSFELRLGVDDVPDLKLVYGLGFY